MIVAGIDTGMATLGWARFDTDHRRFVGVGALKTEKQSHKSKTDDQDDRIDIVAEALHGVIRCSDIVVVERRSFGGGVSSIGPISMCFGALLGIVTAMVPQPPVYTVKPQTWQREIVTNAGKRVNYAAVERVVGGYIRRDADACYQLDCIEPGLRNHAIDGGALALMGAFCLHKCRPIGGRIRA